VNSKAKGARGERLLAAVLTDAGFAARRGVQYHGGTGSPDIICPALARWHWEGKFCETARIRDWLAQTEGDANGKPWIIAWKRRHGPWLALLALDELLDILRETLPPQPPPPSTEISAPPPAPRGADSATEPPTETQPQPTRNCP